MGLPWAKPPPAAPPLPPVFGWPTSPVQYVFSASLFILWAWLIWARFFARTSSYLLDAMRAWMYIPVAVVTMLLMHAAVHGMCEDSGIDLAGTVSVVDNKLVTIAQVHC